MSFWANVFLGKCPSGQMSSGQMSFWANVFLGKCLLGKCISGQMYSGQMYFWANVFLGKRLLHKRLMGKYLSGQMSFWANVFWADVFWANVIWANVVSPYFIFHVAAGNNNCPPARLTGQRPLKLEVIWTAIVSVKCQEQTFFPAAQLSRCCTHASHKLKHSGFIYCAHCRAELPEARETLNCIRCRHR
jgi:hypothetical protein